MGFVVSDESLPKGVLRLVRYEGEEEEVVIPEGIQIIGRKAFAHNQHLRRVELPEGLEVVGIAAFENCTSLEELWLPDSLTTLDYKAFLGCDNLKRLSIPAGIDPHSGPTELYGGCPLKAVRLRGPVSRLIHWALGRGF